jgi:hypothetical protein
MKRLIAAAALTPVLLASGAFAQSVTDEVAMQLWCGTAFTIAFGGEPPEELSADELAQGKAFFDGGTQMIVVAEKAHLDAGFTQDAIDQLKADLIAEVTPVVTGEAQDAKYTFEDCMAILPPPADGAPPDSSSSAM